MDIQKEFDEFVQFYYRNKNFYYKNEELFFNLTKDFTNVYTVEQQNGFIQSLEKKMERSKSARGRECIKYLLFFCRRGGQNIDAFIHNIILHNDITNEFTPYITYFNFMIKHYFGFSEKPGIIFANYEDFENTELSIKNITQSNSREIDQLEAGKQYKITYTIRKTGSWVRFDLNDFLASQAVDIKDIGNKEEFEAACKKNISNNKNIDLFDRVTFKKSVVDVLEERHGKEFNLAKLISYISEVKVLQGEVLLNDFGLAMYPIGMSYEFQTALKELQNPENEGLTRNEAFDQCFKNKEFDGLSVEGNIHPRFINAKPRISLVFAI